MRVLVTGGAGFIGSHLVERLVKDGHDVLVMDDLSTGNLDNLRGIIDPNDSRNFRQLDIRSYEDCADCVRDIEAVFHLAALGSVPRSVENPHGTNAVNVDGTLNMLEAARRNGVERFINSSSSSVYGEQLQPAKHEEMTCRPTSPYGVSKLAAERYCCAYYDTYGLTTVSLRYFNVYGPRQHPGGPYAAVIPRFITQALRGEPLTVYGDGNQTRDFTYVADVVEANMLALDAGKLAWGYAVNVAAGRATPVWYLASAIAARVSGREQGAKYPKFEEPVYRLLPARAGDVMHSTAHVGGLAELLGFDLRRSTMLNDGLAKTIEWFRA
jgi:nucleoside-diphosphate-sugar epimerase